MYSPPTPRAHNHPAQLPKNMAPIMVEMAVSTALTITVHWGLFSLSMEQNVLVVCVVGYL